jgi:hypothetical protein
MCVVEQKIAERHDDTEGPGSAFPPDLLAGLPL